LIGLHQKASKGPLTILNNGIFFYRRRPSYPSSELIQPS
jgi:hypothetical protein